MQSVGFKYRRGAEKLPDQLCDGTISKNLYADQLRQIFDLTWKIRRAP